MPAKYVFIKEIRTQTKNGRTWRQIVTQDGESWNVFLDTPLEVGKCYVFSYEKDTERGWNNLNLVTPLVNLFTQKALKEVANRNDFVRMYSMAFSYSKDLASSGKIELTEMFDWSDKIYGYFQERADREMAKLEKPNDG